MAISLIYGGVDLSKWFRITDVTRNVGTNRTNTLQKIGNQVGKTLLDATDDEGTITVTGYALGDLNSKRREIAAALHPTEETRLIIGDEPDKYYMATVDGQTTMAETYRFGKLEVKFVVPDGRAHGVAVKSVNADANGLVTLNYAGTAPTYPIITATMLSENGFVIFATEKGGVAFGDPEEVDAVAGTRSDKPININYRSTPNIAGYTLNTGCVTMYPQRLFKDGAAYANTFTGSILYGSGGTGEVAAPNFGAKGQKNWHGPAFHVPVTANYNGVNTGDFQYKARIDFAATSTTEGRIEMTLENAGNPELSVLIRDSNVKSTAKTIEYWHGNEMLVSKNLDLKKFPNSFAEALIAKSGNSVTFQFAQIKKLTSDSSYTAGGVDKYTVTIPGLADEPVDGITQWMMQYGDNKAASMYFTDTKFTWVNESTLTNVPNLFDVGDEVTIDARNKTLLVNGVPSNMFTLGNDYSALQITGPQTLIQSGQSNWAEQMAVKVEYEEAFY